MSWWLTTKVVIFCLSNYFLFFIFAKTFRTSLGQYPRFFLANSKNLYKFADDSLCILRYWSLTVASADECAPNAETFIRALPKAILRVNHWRQGWDKESLYLNESVYQRLFMTA